MRIQIFFLHLWLNWSWSWRIKRAQTYRCRVLLIESHPTIQAWGSLLQSIYRHVMHARHSVSMKPNTVKGVSRWCMKKGGLGITENYLDLNMAILPSGTTEDKVHRQLCDRSTCQWNVFSSILLQNTVHNGHHANESTFLVIWKERNEGMKFQGWNGDKKGKAYIIISTPITDLNCRGGLRKRGRETERKQVLFSYVQQTSVTKPMTNNTLRIKLFWLFGEMSTVSQQKILRMIQAHCDILESTGSSSETVKHFASCGMPVKKHHAHSHFLTHAFFGGCVFLSLHTCWTSLCRGKKTKHKH